MGMLLFNKFAVQAFPLDARLWSVGRYGGSGFVFFGLLRCTVVLFFCLLSDIP